MTAHPKTATATATKVTGASGLRPKNPVMRNAGAISRDEARGGRQKSPLSAALAVLKKDPARGVRTVKLKKDYA
jgi:hypothetical protein